MKPDKETLTPNRAKFVIKQLIMEQLYSSYEQRNKDVYIEMCRKNCALPNKNTHLHFVYKGELHNFETTVPPLPRNRLDPSFFEAYERHKREIKEVGTQEIPVVEHFLNQVLNASPNPWDMLWVLPDFLHEMIKEQLVKTGNEGRKLTKEQEASLKEKGIIPIQLMKQRMVHNLLY